MGPGGFPPSGPFFFASLAESVGALRLGKSIRPFPRLVSGPFCRSASRRTFQPSKERNGSRPNSQREAWREEGNQDFPPMPTHDRPEASQGLIPVSPLEISALFKCPADLRGKSGPVRLPGRAGGWKPRRIHIPRRAAPSPGGGGAAKGGGGAGPSRHRARRSRLKAGFLGRLLLSTHRFC